jgi:Zn-dependent protease with chaperone function
MTLPYYMRLLCLCLATFYVVHGLLWIVVRSLTPTALRVAETMRPRTSSRLLFALRMTPVAVTGFLIVGFCVPSYLWLEPEATGEHVSWFCLSAAVLGTAIWTISLLRGLNSVARTEQYLRHCAHSNLTAGTGSNRAQVLVVRDGNPVMAVAGVVHPQLVVSQTVMDALSDEQKEAAFRHEAAHRTSRDNLKKLLFLLAPDVLPGISGHARLERGWARFTEWAADDEAVDGSQDRALSLATALVRIAKLGVQPTPSYLLSTLMDDDRDLATRIDRLLREPAYAQKPMAPLIAISRNLAVVAAGVAATLLLWPESLGRIHGLLEHLMQ